MFAYEAQHCFEVIEIVGELSEMTARSVRPPVADEVVGVHRTAALGKPGPEVLVASAVLGETMHQQQAAFRGRPAPLATEQDLAARSRELRFGSADAGSVHGCRELPNELDPGGQDSARRCTEACFSRTRWR